MRVRPNVNGPGMGVPLLSALTHSDVAGCVAGAALILSAREPFAPRRQARQSSAQKNQARRFRRGRDHGSRRRGRSEVACTARVDCAKTKSWLPP